MKCLKKGWNSILSKYKSLLSCLFMRLKIGCTPFHDYIRLFTAALSFLNKFNYSKSEVNKLLPFVFSSDAEHATTWAIKSGSHSREDDVSLFSFNFSASPSAVESLSSSCRLSLIFASYGEERWISTTRLLATNWGQCSNKEEGEHLPGSLRVMSTKTERKRKSMAYENWKTLDISW